MLLVWNLRYYRVKLISHLYQVTEDSMQSNLVMFPIVEVVRPGTQVKERDATDYERAEQQFLLLSTIT